MKRIFDIAVSFLGLIVLSPLFLVLALWIVFDSKGSPIYKQVRVGKNGKDFTIYKFRTMYKNSDKKGLLTISDHDSRITHAGYHLRKHKLDELPQLINVLLGDMSLVGPRPEVRKYVNMYSKEQQKVLAVKPGITDYASIKYRYENEILANQQNPEQFYIEHIMPDKLKLNLSYIGNRTFFKDIKIIYKTIF